MFNLLIGYNVLVWGGAISLIIPWMERTTDWRLALWLLSYVWIEVFAYMLANSLARCRIRNVLPIPVLLAIAAYIEGAGIKLLK